MTTSSWSDIVGEKLIKYTWVSMVTTMISTLCLLFCHRGLGWSFVCSNVTAVTISTIPAYTLSRRWVWSQHGPSSVYAEIAPFWTIALLGLLLSTLLALFASQFTESSIGLLAANGYPFGLLWLGKFMVLDKVMWI
jgi:putative flippase GtrA